MTSRPRTRIPSRPQEININFWLVADYGTLATIISSDSSDESVGSPPSRVILFGDILRLYFYVTVGCSRRLLLLLLLFLLPAPVAETLLFRFTPPDCVAWFLITGSNSLFIHQMRVLTGANISSLPKASSPFICTESSEAINPDII
ncbi:hypothetical protein Tco_0678899 [Tanacetum coccineum]|uniref:Uncharacterized protein n=1 Tax=Tanacetum coccineum TaxID=301880 RepID=A0ABQ4XGB8_9ASTR